MQLIDALVMCAQEYTIAQGWIISSDYGRIMKAPSTGGAYYYTYDASRNLLTCSKALEMVLAALIEHEPVAARDERWKIEPCWKNDVLSAALDEMAHHTPCTQAHQWDDGSPIRMCTRCGWFDVEEQHR